MRLHPSLERAPAEADQDVGPAVDRLEGGRMDDPLPIVASNLRRLREEAGLSQDALADRALMDAAEIRRIEGAQRDPGVRVLTRLARGLKSPPAALWAGVD